MTNDDERQERLTDLLRDLAAQDARVEPPSSVQRTIMCRWAERQPSAVLLNMAAQPSDSTVRSTSARMSFGLAGIAAALALMTWVGSRPLWSEKPEAPAVKKVDLLSNMKPDRIDPDMLVARGLSPFLKPRVVRRATAPKSEPEPVGLPATSQVEPFVRLLPMTDQELASIRLARVRFRGQTAQTLGLDIRMPPPGIDGFVEADVLVGEDGLARAIRFVR